MKAIAKKYIILALVLLLFLLPIGQALSGVKELQGGKPGLIVLGVFILISIAYWVIMIILINKKK